jgi:tetratricopeptide (TPR) repeat protein
MKYVQSSMTVLLCLTTITFLIYSHVLHAPFVFDDASIRDNASLQARSLSDLWGILWHSSGGRELGDLTFALNFYVGGVQTFGYHLINISIQIVNGWLIFWLLHKTLTLSRSAKARLVSPSDQVAPCLAEHNSAWLIAFFSALIWLVHPVQTQAITYIVQRLTSFSALLYLLSFALYLSGRLRKHRRRYIFYGASALAGLGAMKVKQNTAMLPCFIVLYDLYFFNDSPRKALKKRWGLLVILLVFLVGITIVYLGPDFWVTMQRRYIGRDFTMGERLLTEARVLLYYLSLIALPLPSRLRVDYDFPLSSSLWHPFSTLLAVVVLAMTLWSAVRMASTRPLLSFAILWFLGNLAIESTIIPLDLVYEHRLYLPSLGPIAAATVWISTRLSSRHTFVSVLLLCCTVVTFAIWTYTRNEVWTSPVRLWTDNALKSPGKARVHGNLGKALLDARRYADAAAEFEKALALDPTLLGAYNNLAVIYIDHLHQYEKAKIYLHAAIRQEPHYPEAYLNLGVIALNQKQLAEAIDAFTQVLVLNPQHLLAHYNLAACYINLQNFPKALEVLNRGLSHWPASYQLYLLKGRAHYMANHLLEARQALEKAYVLRPDDPEVQHYYELVK